MTLDTQHLTTYRSNGLDDAIRNSIRSGYIVQTDTAHL